MEAVVVRRGNIHRDVRQGRPVAVVGAESALPPLPCPLLRTVMERLERSPYPILRPSSGCLIVDAGGDGGVHLSGQLPRFYLKQLAFEAVRDIPGVTSVDFNGIAVCRNGGIA